MSLGPNSGKACGVAERRGIAPLSAPRVFLMEALAPFVWFGGWLAVLARRDRERTAMVLRGRILAGSRRAAVGRNVHFVGPARRFYFGECVTLFGNCYLNSNGPNGFVQLGDHSHVDQFCVLYGQGGLTIGPDCAVASGVVIYSQTNVDSQNDGTPVACQPTSYAAVEVCAGSWLGAGVRVLPGVTIGEGCHVGAGAVVTGDLPPFSVAVGVPAKVIKERSR